MQIVFLKINNFRGIKHLECFFNKPLVCLAGRGDSGKTTILEAISYVLSGSRSIDFYDNDFYNADINNPIEIEATIKDFPKEFLQEDKFGLYIRKFDGESISDVITEDDNIEENIVLSINLKVDSSLEPIWRVITNRPKQEPKIIYWSDRVKIRAFMLNDYQDRHFSWAKGSPLQAWLQQYGTEISSNNAIVQAIREVKKQIDNISFDHLRDIEEDLINEVALFGLKLSSAKTTIDFKDIAIKEGRLCFHENNIPFRLKGKGSKRLLSIAVQMLLVKKGAIAIIDEVEQGLEPDRIKQLIRTLKNNNCGQIFLSTHSPSVIEELSCEDIDMVQKKENAAHSISSCSASQQGLIRSCPAALYAEKIIVCEGATEVGLCRAIDRYMQQKNSFGFSAKNAFYIDANGQSKVGEKAEMLKSFQKLVSVLCDSDVKELNDKKANLIQQGVGVWDCEQNKCFEKQLIDDSSPKNLEKIFQFLVSLKQKYDVVSHDKAESILWNDIKKDRNISKDFTVEEAKNALLDFMLSKPKNLRVKSVEYGEGLGDIICKNIEAYAGTRTQKNIEDLINWVKK